MALLKLESVRIDNGQSARPGSAAGVYCPPLPNRPPAITRPVVVGSGGTRSSCPYPPIPVYRTDGLVVIDNRTNVLIGYKNACTGVITFF